MSQDFHHQGIFSFTAPDESQIPIRDNNNKIRLQGFENHHHTLAGVVHAPEGASSSGMHPAVYETAGMLSEMLNFGGGGPAVQQISGAGMQFFLTDAQPRPASPPPQHEFLNWVGPEGGGGVGGLSLSLSSTLEAAKAEEEMRMGGGGGGGGMMFFGSSSNNNNSQGHHSPNQHVMHLQGYGLGHPSGHFGFGSVLTPASSSLGAVHALRNSRFVRPAQELLEEFCSVGRGHQRKNKFSRNDSINSTTSSAATGSGGVGPSSSNSAKNLSVLSPSDRMEHQRRKVKLLSMLDEVERRYSQYCEQLQMVVNSFDVVMGYGAAIPYTALAQKAMSRHFRCLKDAIQVQLKHSCELLGEKDVSMSTGLTKGETPRLKALEHSLRQQRAFNQMGIMEQEAWRPQRGLPERSVNVLRAWLFEHFLHPYPSDADKHLLARQTGLSRNQVSNWFINARVRLWKPMVEDMYQQESKDKGEGEGAGEGEEEEDDDEDGNEDGKRTERETHSNAQTSMPETTENDTSLYSAGVWPAAVSRYADDGGVGLTLGLRHSEGGGGGGNPPEKSGFSFREFGG